MPYWPGTCAEWTRKPEPRSVSNSVARTPPVKATPARLGFFLLVMTASAGGMCCIEMTTRPWAPQETAAAARDIPFLDRLPHGTDVCCPDNSR